MTPRVQLTFATYNIRKAIGLDRRRDPARILAILREIDADIVALQEADRRFGERASALPQSQIAEHSPYQAVPVARRPDSIRSPELQSLAIEAYRKGGFADLAMQGKREYVELYRFSGPVWAARTGHWRSTGRQHAADEYAGQNTG